LTDPATGQVRGVIEYVRDISEARRAAEALREKEEQLRQAHKMEAVGTLAGGVAHDFNNLLTAILGYADLLRRETADGSTGRQRVEEIIRAGNRAAALTRKLLAFSRKQVLSPRTLDLNAVLIDMGDMLRRLIAEDIELVILPAQGPTGVRADPQQIEQVVLNLVVNARDAMPSGGTIVIRTEEVQVDVHHVGRNPEAVPGRHVCLQVQDQGVGMDTAILARIFEPFFTTKDVGKGSGLGLYIVHEIIEEHDGCIAVDSEPGKGTTFLIRLPLIDKV
jgi:signal transduction histidine kinase